MAEVEQRRAAVIGAASGIGRAVAHKLAGSGYALSLHDMDVAGLTDIVGQYSSAFSHVDMRDAATLSALAEITTDGLDALVVTAGVSWNANEFDHVLAVNLTGTASCLELLAPSLRPGGVAVCTASVAAHLLPPLGPEIEAVLADPLATDLAKRLREVLGPKRATSQAAYALSKLGVIRLVQRLARSWAERGLRVCSVSPGIIETPMSAREIAAAPGGGRSVALGPIPRLGQPSEVANAIAFLCSDDASFITGCDLLVDGGWTGAATTEPKDSPFRTALAASRS